MSFCLLRSPVLCAAERLSCDSAVWRSVVLADAYRMLVLFESVLQWLGCWVHKILSMGMTLSVGWLQKRHSGAAMEMTQQLH